jgi:uncharacterized protein involved in exopolysaccharide biosynthesis
MRESLDERPVTHGTTDTAPLFLALVLLRGRRWLLVGGLVGGALGIGVGLSTTRQYRTTATILPEGSDANMSGLAAAASQFGLRVPSGGSAWTPAVYNRMLQTIAFYRSIADDTLSVGEGSGARMALVDLLKIEGATPQIRLEKAQRRLATLVTARELKAVGSVEIAVSTEWPRVSLALANSIVEQLETMALSTRQGQASAERRFIDTRVAEALRGMRDAEQRLVAFNERNRIATAPSLMLSRERLQRDLSIRTQVYTTLLQSQEELRVREARDTPMLTVLERPALAVLPESRRTALKGAIGGMAGGLVTLLWLLARALLTRAREEAREEGSEFFDLVDTLTQRRAA